MYIMKLDTPPLSCSHTPILRHSHTSSAFTLLEVLVSSAIIMVMVLMVCNMFQDASMAWKLGVRKTEINIAGRSAVELMARELTAAVADDVLTFKIINEAGIGANGRTYHSGPPVPFFGEYPDKILFVSLSETPDSNHRDAREVYYYMRKNGDTYELMRGVVSADIVAVPVNHCYKKPLWWNNTSFGYDTLIDNIINLKFCAYDDNGTEITDYYSADPANSNRLPAYVDISLVLLSKDDMTKVADLGGADQAEFINRNAKCYTTRVYFPNREGYEVR